MVFPMKIPMKIPVETTVQPGRARQNPGLSACVAAACPWPAAESSQTRAPGKSIAMRNGDKNQHFLPSQLHGVLMEKP